MVKFHEAKNNAGQDLNMNQADIYKAIYFVEPRNYVGYSEANALQFSQEQAAAHGWSGYGDSEYVAHVMRAICMLVPGLAVNSFGEKEL